MRLVLDTNIVLSALLWRGAPHRLFSEIQQRLDTVHLFSSEFLLTELASVLARAHLAERLARINLTAERILIDYATAVNLVVPQTVPKLARDPDDDQVLACALAAGADAIVSGDADLLVLGSYEGIPVLTANEVLERIRQQG